MSAREGVGTQEMQGRKSQQFQPSKANPGIQLHSQFFSLPFAPGRGGLPKTGEFVGVGPWGYVRWILQETHLGVSFVVVLFGFFWSCFLIDKATVCFCSKELNASIELFLSSNLISHQIFSQYSELCSMVGIPGSIFLNNI